MNKKYSIALLLLLLGTEQITWTDGEGDDVELEKTEKLKDDQAEKEKETTEAEHAEQTDETITAEKDHDDPTDPSKTTQTDNNDSETTGPGLTLDDNPTSSSNFNAPDPNKETEAQEKKQEAQKQSEAESTNQLDAAFENIEKPEASKEADDSSDDKDKSKDATDTLKNSASKAIESIKSFFKDAFSKKDAYSKDTEYTNLMKEAEQELEKIQKSASLFPKEVFSKETHNKLISKDPSLNEYRSDTSKLEEIATKLQKKSMDILNKELAENPDDEAAIRQNYENTQKQIINDISSALGSAKTVNKAITQSIGEAKPTESADNSKESSETSKDNKQDQAAADVRNEQTGADRFFKKLSSDHENNEKTTTSKS